VTVGCLVLKLIGIKFKNKHIFLSSIINLIKK
jgi:hypothetical protein